jgi:hypothetical protein
MADTKHRERGYSDQTAHIVRSTAQQMVQANNRPIDLKELVDAINAIHIARKKPFSRTTVSLVLQHDKECLELLNAKKIKIRGYVSPTSEPDLIDVFIGPDSRPLATTPETSKNSEHVPDLASFAKTYIGSDSIDEGINRLRTTLHALETARERRTSLRAQALELERACATAGVPVASVLQME